MVTLNTQQVITNFNSPPSIYNSGGSFKVEVPQSNVMIPKPLSYDFRVVESIKDGQITKVGLQYQVWEHDSYGMGTLKQDWTDVVRVQQQVDTE